MRPKPPKSTLFPYTTLFRSQRDHGQERLPGSAIAGKTDGFWKFVSAEVFCKQDRKSTRLNSSHTVISYAVFCLKKKKYMIIPMLCLTIFVIIVVWFLLSIVA